MADPHAHQDHGPHEHGEHAPAGGWFATFVLSLGFFLAIWLTVLFVGHTLAGRVAD